MCGGRAAWVKDKVQMQERLWRSTLRKASGFPFGAFPSFFFQRLSLRKVY